MPVQSRSLMTLPGEVLSGICRALCFHCSGYPIEVITGHWDEHVANEKALIALSRTCKTFRTWARPILFHVMAEPSDLDHFPQITRTLTEKPELATCIANLVFPRLQDKPLVAVTRTTNPFYETLHRSKEVAKLLEEHQLVGNNPPNTLTPDESPLSNPSVQTPSMDNGRSHPGQPLFPSALLMAVASTVEEMHITVNEDFHSKPVAQIKDPAGWKDGVGHFVNLRRLAVSLDTNEGTIGDIRNEVCAIGPNLEEIVVDQCCRLLTRPDEDIQSVPPSKPPVRAVGIKGGLYMNLERDMRVLRGWLKYFGAQLEHFSYEPRPVIDKTTSRLCQDALSAKHVVEACEPIKDTIKSLKLDYSIASIVPTDLPINQLPSFIGFTALEKLTIDHIAFCTHPRLFDDSRTSSSSPSLVLAPTCVTRLIHPSLRHLHVKLTLEASAWNDVYELATCAHSFPNLTHVTLEVVYPRFAVGGSPISMPDGFPPPVVEARRRFASTHFVFAIIQSREDKIADPRLERHYYPTPRDDDSEDEF